MEDDWIEWNGGECPVEPETIVMARCRNGSEYDGAGFRAGAFDWGRFPDSNVVDAGQDIVAYRVVQP